MSCELQRVHGRITAHEADDGPLDRRPEPEPVHDVDIDTGGVDSGAAGNDEMRHFILEAGRVDGVQGRRRQVRSMLLKEAHARQRVRKPARPIKTLGLEERLRREEGIAVVDLRALGQPAEGRLRFPAGERGHCEFGKRAMNVEGRNGDANPVDESGGHGGVPHRKERDVERPGRESPRPLKCHLGQFLTTNQIFRGAQFRGTM